MNKITYFIFAAMFAELTAVADNLTPWLNYAANTTPCRVKANDHSPAARTAADELAAFWRGCNISLVKDRSMADNDGFTITHDAAHDRLTVKAHKSSGLLYGAYHLLRIQTEHGCEAVNDTTCIPVYRYRLLQPYAVQKDNFCLINMNDVDDKKGTMSISMREYMTRLCRACASVGINGIILPNAGSPAKALALPYINKVKVIERLCNSYGIKVFITTSTSVPYAEMSISAIKASSGTITKWWRDNIKNVYRELPFLGGFSIKTANAINRNSLLSSAEADMKARIIDDAASSYGGIVMVDRNVSSPQSLVFSSEEAAEGYAQSPVAGGNNVVTVLRLDQNGLPPSIAYAEVSGLQTGGKIMAELLSRSAPPSDSIEAKELTAEWHKYLSSNQASSMLGFVLKYCEWDDEPRPYAQFSRYDLYAYGRSTWNPNLTDEDVNSEWFAQLQQHNKK